MIYGMVDGLDDLQATVDQTVMDLRLHADDFDFIAVRGCSGMLVGAPVSLALDKPLVVVRKPDEQSHSYGKTVINRRRALGRFIFLDDFVSSGRTRNATLEALAEWGGCEYVATYAYDGYMSAHPGYRRLADESKWERGEILQAMGRLPESEKVAA